MIFLFLIIILMIILIFFIVRIRRYKKDILTTFENGNVIVFGLKGCGKDLIFNYAINNRNENCYSNIQYNESLCTIKPISDFSVEPNTFENVLNNNVVKCKKTNKEKTDYYISDGGIYLPSQYSNTLCKKYPSLPIYYALSRHLTNSNIHINSQYLGRVWDKLREQAAYYILAKKSIKIFNWIITYYNIYDTYATALAKEDKIKNSALITRAETRARIEEQAAKSGMIKSGFIIQNIKNINYDSRYFHQVFYNSKSPDTTD